MAGMTGPSSTTKKSSIIDVFRDISSKPEQEQLRVLAQTFPHSCSLLVGQPNTVIKMAPSIDLTASPAPGYKLPSEIMKSFGCVPALPADGPYDRLTCIELDRGLSAYLVLNCLLEGTKQAYDRLVEAQTAPRLKLKFDQFLALSAQLKEQLNTPARQAGALYSTAFNDFGKRNDVPEAVAAVLGIESDAVEHDAALAFIMKLPLSEEELSALPDTKRKAAMAMEKERRRLYAQFFPDLERVRTSPHAEDQAFIRAVGMSLGCMHNICCSVQAEDTADMLINFIEAYEKCKTQEQRDLFKALIMAKIIPDVAATFGHLKPRGSSWLTGAHDNFMLAFKTLFGGVDAGSTPLQIQLNFLEARLQLIRSAPPSDPAASSSTVTAFQMPPQFTMGSPEWVLRARFILHIRAEKPVQAQIIIQALDRFETDSRADYHFLLQAYGKEHSYPVWMQYSPDSFRIAILELFKTAVGRLLTPHIDHDTPGAEIEFGVWMATQMLRTFVQILKEGRQTADQVREARRALSFMTQGYNVSRTLTVCKGIQSIEETLRAKDYDIRALTSIREGIKDMAKLSEEESEALKKLVAVAQLRALKELRAFLGQQCFSMTPDGVIHLAAVEPREAEELALHRHLTEEARARMPFKPPAFEFPTEGEAELSRILSTNVISGDHILDLGAILGQQSRQAHPLAVVAPALDPYGKFFTDGTTLSPSLINWMSSTLPTLYETQVFEQLIELTRGLPLLVGASFDLTASLGDMLTQFLLSRKGLQQAITRAQANTECTIRTVFFGVGDSAHDTPRTFNPEQTPFMYKKAAKEEPDDIALGRPVFQYTPPCTTLQLEALLSLFKGAGGGGNGWEDTIAGMYALSTHVLHILAKLFGLPELIFVVTDEFGDHVKKQALDLLSPQPPQHCDKVLADEVIRDAREHARIHVVHITYEQGDIKQVDLQIQEHWQRAIGAESVTLLPKCDYERRFVDIVVQAIQKHLKDRKPEKGLMRPVDLSWTPTRARQGLDRDGNPDIRPFTNWTGKLPESFSFKDVIAFVERTVPYNQQADVLLSLVYQPYAQVFILGRIPQCRKEYDTWLAARRVTEERDPPYRRARAAVPQAGARTSSASASMMAAAATAATPAASGGRAAAAAAYPTPSAPVMPFASASGGRSASASMTAAAATATTPAEPPPPYQETPGPASSAGAAAAGSVGPFQRQQGTSGTSFPQGGGARQTQASSRDEACRNQ